MGRQFSSVIEMLVVSHSEEVLGLEKQITELVELLGRALPDVKEQQAEIEAMIKDEGSHSSIYGELLGIRDRRQALIDRMTKTIGENLAKPERTGP